MLYVLVFFDCAISRSTQAWVFSSELALQPTSTLPPTPHPLDLPLSPTQGQYIQQLAQGGGGEF